MIWLILAFGLPGWLFWTLFISSSIKKDLNRVKPVSFEDLRRRGLVSYPSRQWEEEETVWINGESVPRSQVAKKQKIILHRGEG